MTKDKDNKPSREEIREYALKFLNDKGFNKLALAYAASQEAYGKAGMQAAHDFGYIPAMSEGGKAGDMIRQALLESRDDGELYSGNVSEKGLIKTAYNTLLNSATQVKVSDIAEKIRYDLEKIPEAYRGLYMEDLLKKDAAEEAKKVGQALMGAYQQVFVDNGMADALNARAKSIPGNLEKILNPEGGKD